MPFFFNWVSQKEMEYELAYRNMMLDAHLKGESNDCSVRSLALATMAVKGKSTVCYNSAHKDMSYAGRKFGKGAYTHQIKKGARLSGLKLTRIKRLQIRGVKNITFNNASRWLPRGTYYLLSRNHITTMIDGEIYDWSKGRRHHVREIFKVENAINV